MEIGGCDVGMKRGMIERLGVVTLLLWLWSLKITVETKGEREGGGGGGQNGYFENPNSRH